MKKLLAIVLCGIMVLSLSACGSQPAAPAAEAAAPAAEAAASDDAVKLGVPVYKMEHQFYIDLMGAVEDECKKENVTLISDDSGYDAVKQISLIENMVTQGVDAMIISAIDPAGIVPTVQEAQSKGIKIIVEANELFDDNGEFVGDCFVGINNYDAALLAGQEAGKAWKEQHPDVKANIAVISYPIEEACIQRENGFVDGFKEQVPDAEVVASQNGEAVRDKAMSVMENILTAHPEVNVAFGINDDSALGAYAAMQSRGITSDAMVVGFDGTDDAVAAIKEGGIYFGDVVQDGDAIGRGCVQAAKTLATGGTVDQYVNIPSSFITIKDVQ